MRNTCFSFSRPRVWYQKSIPKSCFYKTPSWTPFLQVIFRRTTGRTDRGRATTTGRTTGPGRTDGQRTTTTTGRTAGHDGTDGENIQCLPKSKSKAYPLKTSTHRFFWTRKRNCEPVRIFYKQLMFLILLYFIIF